MNYKHIICCGCSFTRQQGRINLDVMEDDFLNDDAQFFRWPHHLQLIMGDDVKVYNLGNPTNDNSIIRKNIIYKIEELIKNGVSTKDIFVFVQWSSWQRNSFFISNQKAKEFNSLIDNNRGENSYAHISDFIKDKKYNGEFGYYFLTGGFMVDHIPYEVKKIVDKYVEFFYSEEESLIRFFDNILFLQSFLNDKGVNYLCFNLQNNFSKEYVTIGGFPVFVNDENKVYKSIYIDKYIPKTDDINLSYDNPYIQHLFNLIDFNKFWFLQNNDTFYGGLMEWSIKRYDINKDKNNDGLWQEWAHRDSKQLKQELSNRWGESYQFELGHPSAKMNEIFTNEVLLKYVR